MSNDVDCCAVFICVCAFAVIGFIFMTVASPGFLLYGFFSGEWLIEDISNSSIVNQTSGDYNIYYGLYEKCYQGNCSNYVVDETAYGLEVTSVVFQFLAILALPWLKLCVHRSKWLTYWNYCLIPFMLLAELNKDMNESIEIIKNQGGQSRGLPDCVRGLYEPVIGYHSFVYFVAVFSLCASLYFLDEYSSKEPTVYPGKSQECAGLGGGFQIVLALFITGFCAHKQLLCFQKPAVKDARPMDARPTGDSQSYATAGFARIETIFVAIFSYQSEEEWMVTWADPEEAA